MRFGTNPYPLGCLACLRAPEYWFTLDAETAARQIREERLNRDHDGRKEKGGRKWQLETSLHLLTYKGFLTRI
jgi:hypothetical protein